MLGNWWKDPSKLPIAFAAVAALLRLAVAMLFILAVFSTRDPEPWFFPLQLDFPGTFVTRTIWQLTGWPAEYRGPADPAFMVICVVTWALIGGLLGFFAASLRRLRAA